MHRVIWVALARRSATAVHGPLLLAQRTRSMTYIPQTRGVTRRPDIDLAACVSEAFLVAAMDLFPYSQLRWPPPPRASTQAFESGVRFWHGSAGALVADQDSW